MSITPRRRNEPGRNPLTLQSLAQLCSILWIVFFPFVPASGESYWAYVPSPPMLHPVTWEDGRVPIYTNNTQVMGLQSAAHIWPTTAPNFTFSGLSKHFPICFTRNETASPHCVPVKRVVELDGTNYTKPGNHWIMELIYPSFNCSSKGMGTPPQRYPPCTPKVPNNDYGFNWRTCHANVTVCNSKICDWAEFMNPPNPCMPTKMTAGLWTGNNRTWQPDL